MIPRAHVVEWSRRTPWSTDAQVEQDLVISRAIVEVFSDDRLRADLPFRGGTALHKLYLKPPERYSEDLDLVQVEAGAIGPTLDRLRDRLDPWLGRASSKQSQRMVTLQYRFDSETKPPIPLRLKVEINTREQFALDGFRKKPFQVDSRWFSGEAHIKTYSLEELLATKLRALYQRRKGRDVFDLVRGLDVVSSDGAERIASHFLEYLFREGNSVTRQEFLDNLEAKRDHAGFLEDVSRFLASDAPRFDSGAGLDRIARELLAHLPE